jgi:hypothetical protein
MENQASIENSEWGPDGYYDNLEGQLTSQAGCFGNGIKLPPVSRDQQHNLQKSPSTWRRWAGATSVVASSSGGHPPTRTTPTWKRRLSLPAERGGRCLPSAHSAPHERLRRPGEQQPRHLVAGNAGHAGHLPGSARSCGGRHRHTTPSRRGFAEHWAISWDIDGIGGGPARAQLYRNGAVIAASNDPWPAGIVRALWLGGMAWCNGDRSLIYASAAGVYDNIRVWDHARTSFPDMDSECPEGWAGPLPRHPAPRPGTDQRGRRRRPHRPRHADRRPGGRVLRAGLVPLHRAPRLSILVDSPSR